jgi:Ca2+-binding RTX toxin-like protein
MKLLKMALIMAALVALFAAASSADAAGLVRHGGNGPDTITGTKYADKLYGENGPDSLKGRSGNDFLSGGPGGGDVCIGGRGADRFSGCEVEK